MKRLDFTVDSDKCVQCDACVMDCPAGIISRSGNLPRVSAEEETNCIKCQHCLAVCPSGAIGVFGLRPENSIELTAEKLPSAQQMHTLLRGRRSVRQYREESVPSSLIDELLATLSNAPTGCNDMDLHFLVVDSKAMMQLLLGRIIESLEEKMRGNAALPGMMSAAVSAYRQGGADIFFRGAPHLLIVSAGERATCPKEDIDLSLAYFELLAACSGLGTTWCGFLKFIVDAAPELRPCLGLGADTQFYAMLFGYPGVQYARTVQRDGVASVRRFTPAFLDK